MYDKCIFRSIASPAECQSGCLAFRVASGRVAGAAPLRGDGGTARVNL